MAIFKIVLAVRDTEGLTCPQKVVLLHLSTYTSASDGSRIYVPLDLLVRKTGLNERTIRVVLRQLHEQGWLEFESMRRQRVKGYALILEKLGITKEETEIKPRAKAPAEQHYPPYEDGLAETPAGSGALEQLRTNRKRRQKPPEIFQEQ